VQYVALQDQKKIFISYPLLNRFFVSTGFIGAVRTLLFDMLPALRFKLSRVTKHHVYAALDRR
jgi:hypothetical protein